MSNTLYVQNGQVVLDQALGQIRTVEGERKAAQDMAECLTQRFLPEQEYGSFLTDITSNKLPYGGEIFIRHYVAEAIKLLQQKQANDEAATTDELIAEILELTTVVNDNGDAAFFVRVSTESGGSAEAIGATPVMLEHLQEDF